VCPPEGAAGGNKTTPSASERCESGVWRDTTPKMGPNPAAAIPIPLSSLPSVRTQYRPYAVNIIGPEIGSMRAATLAKADLRRFIRRSAGGIRTLLITSARALATA
jgi:hypothetical protein